jgi:hypothetical protein
VDSDRSPARRGAGLEAAKPCEKRLRFFGWQ